MRALTLSVIASATACSSVHSTPETRDAASDASPDARSFLECNCNVLAQAGCDVGQKCAWVYTGIGPDPLGYLTCVPNGSVAAGGECNYGPDVPEMYPMTCVSGSYDNCVHGTACWNGTCEQICGLQMPLCGVGQTCVMHERLLEYNGTYFAGVCE
jgi:hypothetical protein